MFHATAREKADILDEKTKFVVEKFDLPTTEDVVQGKSRVCACARARAFDVRGMSTDYHCGLWKTLIAVQGRMYITENYVCFHAALPTTIDVSFALDEIKSLKRYSPLFVVPSGIEIVLTDGTKVVRADDFGVRNA